MRQTEITVSHEMRDLLRVIEQPSLQTELLVYLARRAARGDTVKLHVTQVELPRLTADADGGPTFTSLHVPAVINGLTGGLIGRWNQTRREWAISTHT